MVSVRVSGANAYTATSDLSISGLKAAAERARMLAAHVVHSPLGANDGGPEFSHDAEHTAEVEQPWESMSLEDKVGVLQNAATTLKIHDRIVDWEATLFFRREQTLLLSSHGNCIEQCTDTISPGLRAIANHESDTQQRTLGIEDTARQGGFEQADLPNLPRQARRISEEALALLDAAPCPAGQQDLVLMPNQMILQIHESIGHPLELDRILGDERNYAGTSFVTPQMFGEYRYGSELLNVVFDPDREGQLATYAFDDTGTTAEHQYIIRDGILQRPLGGAHSQARANLPGVACARACSWNRPPIDRMGNLNMVADFGDLNALIAGVENGVLLDTNKSWSIDHRRNKFQFGCEYGRLIRDGQLSDVIRDANYRGMSAEFWRSLKAVGGPETLEVRGLLSCGKGEPNQQIHVGHAAPACVFSNATVFPGA